MVVHRPVHTHEQHPAVQDDSLLILYICCYVGSFSDPIRVTKRRYAVVNSILGPHEAG